MLFVNLRGDCGSLCDDTAVGTYTDSSIGYTINISDTKVIVNGELAYSLYIGFFFSEENGMACFFKLYDVINDTFVSGNEFYKD